MIASAIPSQWSRVEEWRTTSSGQPIPSGWELVRLGEMAEHCLGKMLDKQKQIKGEPLPYLRNPNVKWFEFDLSRLETMRFQEQELKRYELRDGDVIICEGGEPGRAAIWHGGPTEIKFQKALHRVRTSPGLYNKFLVHRLRADAESGRLRWYFTGTTIKHLTGQDLNRYLFPLPPLDEQRRIAAILDKADAIRRKREEGVRLTEELLRSTFLEMFGDPALNTRNWEIARMGSVCRLDRGRSRHRPRDEPSLYGGAYPLVQTGDISNSDGYITSFEQTYSECGLAQSKLWPSGTLCITIAANIAKTAILKIEACFPDSIVGLIAGNSLTTEYVRFWFVAMEKTIDAAAPQVAQKNINLAILSNLNICIPPIELQRAFSERVLAIYGAKRKRLQASSESDLLFDALVQRAFAGAL